MIFVTGDCHGEYGRFSVRGFPQQKEMDRTDLVILAGDFGYWDRSPEQKYWLDWLEQRILPSGLWTVIMRIMICWQSFRWNPGMVERFSLSGKM